MALGTPTLATPSVGGGNTNITTASFTPTLGATLLAFGASRSSSLPGAIGLTPSALTWTPLIAGLFDNGSGVRVRARAWAAVASSAPSMTVRIDSTGAAKCGLMMVEITGAAGAPPNVAVADDVNGDPSMTLGSAPLASSTGITFLAAAGSNAVSAPSGFTELDEQTFNTDLKLELAYDAGSPGTSAAYSTTNARAVGIYVEVVAATGGGMVLRPRLRARGLQALLVR